MAISLVVINFLPVANKDTFATSGTSITKSSTADFDLGTNTNTNTAGDEMKMVANPRTAWYQTGGTWNYRKKIIIDHTKVPNTDQTDFPVLINIASDSDLASKAQDDGDDILLTQDDETTKLSHEIESYTTASGALVLWVKIPLLSHTYDTTVYLYYGNASATSQQNKTAVWSNGYAGVWHLNDPTNPTSSTGTNNGTDHGATTVTNGKIGNAGSFNGTSDYISVGSNYNITGKLNMSGWFYLDSDAPSAGPPWWGGRVIFDGKNASYVDLHYMSVAGITDGKFGGGFNWTSGIASDQRAAVGSNTTASLGSWHYIATSYDQSNFRLFVDGVEDSNSPVARTAAAQNLTVSNIGRFADSGLSGFWDGYLDNIQISNTARSSDWIATEYANQNAPGSFYSIQTETAKISVNIASNNISTDWYTINSTEQTAWKYRRQITVDHTKVPNTDQSEFPMLVKITDATDPIFSKAQADGDDILFTNTSGNIKLAHEIETFNTTTKELWAWVKIPNLKTATDTTIWLYYGNAAATSQQSATAVWSNGYAGVWHLSSATGAIENDSTSNANNSSSNGSAATAGKINGASAVDGNDYINVGTMGTFGGSGRGNGFSMSSWVNTTDQNAIYSVMGVGDSGSGTNAMTLKLNSGSDNTFLAGSVRANVISTDVKILTGGTNTNDVPSGSWTKITVNIYPSTNVVQIYVNGLSKSVTYAAQATPSIFANFSNNLYLGALNLNGTIQHYFKGSFDETRISSTARSADWIATEYANQNAPGTFATVSKESAYYPVAGTAGWYSTGGTWMARQAVTIDHTKVPNTDQTDFPVLINISNQSNGVFAGAQSDGDDILFTSVNGTTKLSHEIESFSTTAGSKALVAWVKVPTLSHTTDTVLYMYYGNASATAPSAAEKQAVWSNGYMAVYHMNQPSGNLLDSASNGFTGTPSGGVTYSATGKVGKAISLNGTTITTGATFPAGNVTMEYWGGSDDTNAQGTAIANIVGGVDVTLGLDTSGANSRQWAIVRPTDGNVYGSTNTISGLHFGAATMAATAYTLYANGTANGSAGTSGNPTAGILQIAARGGQTWLGVLDEVRLSSIVRSADWIATEYANQNDPGSFESFSMESSNISYTSPTSTAGGSGIIDTVWNGGWGTPNGFSSAVTIPTNTSINYQMRSSIVGGSTDGDWTSWYDLGTATTTGTFSVATASVPAGITKGTNRYLQTKAVLASTDGASTPIMSDYTIYYLADTAAPTNPSVTAATAGTRSFDCAQDDCSNVGWINESVAPVFTFSGSSDGGAGESGVAGYYLYYGTNVSADPVTYQAHAGAIGDNQTYSPSGSIDGSRYYFRAKTIDVAGNVSAAATLFDLGYDTTLPTRPTFVASDPAGYTTTNSFTFTWPAGGDPNGAGGGASGIKWYEYKRATDGAWSHTADAATRTVADIEAYQEGANAFYVRTIDNAGNTSSNYQQVTYYWSGVAPAKPDNLAVTPDTSDSNSFTVSWDKPAVGAGDPPIVGYYYSINATPTIGNVTYKASTADSVSIGPDAYATLQGVNTIYVLSVNSAGNLSYESAYVASDTFTCVTVAPATPTSVSLYDSSDRTLDRWMLTTQWVGGSTGSPSTTDHYAIYRSTDGIGFSLLATTTSTAYIDASGLNNSTTYYYNIKAVDIAGKESAQSSTVSKMPTGKYLTPPTILSNPIVTELKSSSAKISWTTDRASSSIVRYGMASTSTSTSASSTGNLDATTNHTVTLLGINSGTPYNYEVQSLDEDRDYSPDSAYSTTYSFTTLPAPAISDVSVSNIALTTADISFATTTVANSTIYYGAGATNLEIKDVTGTGTINHTVKLSSLNPGTSYNFKIAATDIDGDTLKSDNYSFRTIDYPAVSDLEIEEVPDRPSYTVHIKWKTNVETTTIATYSISGSGVNSTSGAQGEKTNSTPSTSHEVEISGLLDQKDYTITVTGRDQFGNLATASSKKITTPKDSRPPKISDFNIETSTASREAGAKSQVIASWKTDEPSTSRVEYSEGVGSDTFLRATADDGSLGINHIVIIGNLDNQKPYHFRAVSLDSSANSSYSESVVVVTKKPIESVFDIIMDALQKSLGFLSRLF